MTISKMLREVIEQKEWNELYSQAKSASGKFLQSWDWGEFQRSVGRKVFRFADDSAIAQVIELPLPFNMKYWFCPKGPVMENEPCPPEADPPLAETMDNTFIEELKNKAKGAGAVFLRIEPLEKVAGKKLHDISPRCTSIVDLADGEGELLAAMHQKTRYNIKVAAKHGVAVRSLLIVHRSFDEVWNLFSETATRDGFNLHPREYYEKQIKMPGVEVFAAEHGGKILAAAIVMFDPSAALGAGGVATYLHGASSNEMRNLMAPYALHWEIIKKAKERGCVEYDLWGISDDPKSGWAGITRFKRGWGGTDLCAAGTIDLPVNHFWYSVYRLARRMRP